MDIKEIIFDIGDTILFTEEIISQSLDKAFAKLESNGLISDRFEWSTEYKQVSKELNHLHINHLFSDRKLISKVISSILGKKDLIITGSFLTYFRENVRKSLDIYPIDIKLFDLLKKRGYTLNIISDGTTIEALEILTRLGIIKYFSRIVISEDIGVEKPSPVIFKEFLLNGIKPSNYLMVGNDEIRDIIGAKKIGFKTALVSKRDFTTSEADFIIRNISELQQILNL